MSIPAMSLGLPPDIDAEPSAIESGAETLDGICQTMYGRAEGLDGQFTNTAIEFTDLVSWDISSASAKELESWREAGVALTNGAAVLRLWAEDIKAYRLVRSELQQRWETAKIIAQTRVDSPVVSASTSGRSGGFAEGVVDAVTSTKASRESEEKTALMGLACELALEHDAAWEILMDQADQVEKDLREGPSEKTLERLVDSGHLGWSWAGVLPDGEAPMEEFTENATPGAVNVWWNSLSQSDQQAAMEDYPEILRGLGGIPVVVRDELNRDYLEELIEGNLGAAAVDPKVGLGSLNLLGDLDLMREILKDDDKFLIDIDPMAPGGGAAVISTGNPDLADNVSTMVPGMLNDAGGMGVLVGRADDIHSSMNGNDPSSENASITWMGYNTPFSGGWSPGEAANDLNDFQEGLRATHQGGSPSHNTVVGHSFGGYVAGVAANPDFHGVPGDLDADALVLIGAPGASVQNVNDLSVDEENVHIIQGDDDAIETARELSGMASDGFGTALHAEEFYADPENPGETLGNRLDPEEDTGHSGYFEDEESLGYLGDVLTGGRP